MSFCLRPNICKKCGKPLTLFEGWTCLECENRTVLDKIRDKIDLETRIQVKHYTNTDDVIDTVLQIIDEYMTEYENEKQRKEQQTNHELCR